MTWSAALRRRSLGTTLLMLLLTLTLTLTLAVAACGDSSDEIRLPGDTPTTSVGPVTSTSVAAPTATTTARAPAGRTCAAIALDGLKLQRDYAQEVRGIAGADEAKYKARARALADEARRVGCAVPPGVEDFLR